MIGLLCKQSSTTLPSASAYLPNSVQPGYSRNGSREPSCCCRCGVTSVLLCGTLTNLYGNLTDCLFRFCTQIATGNRQVLVLSMDFTPSLALYIWQSFRKGLWQAVQQYDDVKDVWVFAAEICSTQGCIAESMSDSTAFLSALLALDPLRPLSVFRLLHDAYPRHPPDPYTLPQEQPMVQNLLLFAQLLAAVAADNSSVLKMEIASVAPDSTEHREILRSAIASKLQQLTDISSCTPALLSNSTTGQTGAPQALPAPSQRVITLRSAALISKLATLTFSVKADLVGHLDPEMPMSVQSLWHSMSTLARSLNKLAQLDGAMSDGASQEDQALCFQLCMLLVDTLRQASKEAQAGKQKQACLGLLWAALINMLTELLRSAVKKLGKETAAILPLYVVYLLCFVAASSAFNCLALCEGLLPLLVAFLDHGKEEARYALQILMLLCAPRIDSGSQHADLLARLQGVRRLSNIFTAVQASKGPAKASGLAPGPSLIL